MSTAMDDGRQESPGEQTLSFPPVTDEGLTEVRDNDALDGGDKKVAPAAASPEAEGPAEKGGEEAVADDEPVNFFAARKKPTGPADRAVAGMPGGGASRGEEEAEFSGPSLFVKPASRGGPETPPKQDEPSAAEETASAEGPRFGDEPDESVPAAADEAPAPAEIAADEASVPASASDGEKLVVKEAPDADAKPEETRPGATQEEPEPAEPEPAEAGAAEAVPTAVTSDGAEPAAAASGGVKAAAIGSDGAEPADGAKAATTGSNGAKPGGEELPPETVETLMAALDTLRESVADLRFGLELPGAEEARSAQADLLTQLQDYVLPRVKTNTAPALIVVAGSTGSGKSTLVNTLAEKNISRTGVRRPTTGTPVLACHPDDRKWFMEGDLLGGLERLDKPSQEAGLRSLVVVATEKLPQGVALLDTPDIDSVVEEHHEIAHRMLDAADLWIFVTTAARYADAPAWNLLRLAKERGARLAIVLSRVQPRSGEVVLKHFVRMLTEYGLGEIDRFVINEAKVQDGRLPDSEVTDLRLWLAELSVDEERRAQAVRETLNGVLDSFRTRVPALAKHLEGQVAFRTELRSDVEAAFLSALSEIDKASKNGSLLHGEVLARWQDFAGSGDLMRSLQLRKRGRAAKQAPERVLAFRSAIRTGLESLIVAAANRAAEEVAARWRHRSELGAKLAEGLDRPSDDLVRHTSRAIATWQEHLSELVRTEGVAKRSVSKLVSFDPDSLALIFTVAMFSGTNGEGVPHRLVTALLGAESLRGIGAKALSDLRARIGMLFDEESMRYVQALDSAGIPDESVATRLYQATYNLEVAR
ncbi:dynamin family protein [Nonomuraea sp. NPDC046802]|uniref:dynamin family protein n=1 Tax=Nonomuraea sp. NPDC046802 TaxID=3154919 RepID=UPI0033F1BC6F